MAQAEQIAPRYKRSRYFVKPDLQTKYAFMFVLTIGLGINLGVILTLTAPLLRDATSWVFQVVYCVLALSVVVVVAGISILFTHKIAGPIYKIERSFRQIMDEKDLSQRVFLRTGDELQELAEEINRLLDHLRNSLLIERQKGDALLIRLDHLIGQLEQKDHPDQTELVAQIREVRERLEDTSIKFKLD